MAPDRLEINISNLIFCFEEHNFEEKTYKISTIYKDIKYETIDKNFQLRHLD
jgi:hypothetical protein